MSGGIHGLRRRASLDLPFQRRHFGDQERQIRLREAESRRRHAVVLDVRETSEWSAGHIPNARHIALGQLDKHLSELEKFKSRPVIICCASGNRSSSACGTLKRAGFERVFNLSGGLGAWTGAGLPVTTKS